MKNKLLDFAFQPGIFQTDRWLTAVIGLLFLLCLWGFLRQRLSKQDKKLFWWGLGAVALSLGLTFGLYHWRLPRGLAAQYFPNLSWTPAPPGELDRYFEADGTGRRLDRFIDFNFNDFNLHTFRAQPFSVDWQGLVYVPADGYRLNLVSSFDAELFVDDTLAAASFEGAATIDFGAPKARQYLLKGWSFDESSGGAQPFGFVWAAHDETQLLLRAENTADYQLQFRCNPFSYPGSPQQELRVFIQDVLVQKVMLQKGWKTYTLDIPKTLVQKFAPGTILMTFRFSHVAKPSEVLGSQDPRQLAAAFDVVTFRKKNDDTESQPSTQEAALEPEFPQGWYRLHLKAKTIANNRTSHIRLTWGRGHHGRKRVIPEDVLFPEAGHFQTVMPRVRFERFFLYSLIVCKVFVLLFLLGWLSCVIIRPNFHLVFKKEVIFLIVIGLLAYGVRVAFLMEKSIIDSHFYLLESGTDQANYVAYARGIFRGYWPGLTHKPFYFNVLNAFYIALTFVLCGENLFATRMITAGLSIASMVFVYLIAKRVFQKPVASLAALLYVCNGILLFYDTSLIVAPLKIFLTLGALWLLMTLQDEVSWKATIGAGVFLGLSALARSTVFLFMPLVMAWLLWRLPTTFPRKFAHCTVICCVMAATIAPVTIRNYYSNDAHPLVLITGGGVVGLNLWAANNPSSTGMFGFSQQLYQAVKARIVHEETTFLHEVVTFVKEHPLDYVALEYKKLKYFWRGYEPGNLLSYHFLRPRSKILSFPWFNFLIISPLSLVGVFLARKTWKRTWLLYGFVVVQMGLLLIFWVLARYRIVTVPVLSIFAAYTLWFVWQVLHQKRWAQAGFILAASLLLYVALNYPDAAFDYQQHHGQPMPVIRIVRYWDLFEW